MTTTTTDYASIANSFYLAFYGRPADPVGLKFWSQQVANVNGDLTSIVNAFATSQEAQDRFGSDSTADRITEIYQQLFNRNPETEGLAFWQNAVEKGNASLADVALSILKGSQGTDGKLVELRQQAMDKFTAQVEATGSQYVGAASIEAARILVRAVTLEATSTDIDSLVKAAVSFADTATKTPAVVDAIATGTTLNKLFDTVRGTADPVALAQTLADTAKAAAGNPATLDSLLRGGGMDKVLKVMPADATLKDVVKALAAGGLPAAVEVVYPTKPVVAEPVAGLTLSFKTVSHDLNDLHPDDNVTNVKTANVSFNASKALASGQHVEYSVDGGQTWVKDGTGVTMSGNVITIKDVDLSHDLPKVHTMTAIDDHANVETTISLRVVDGSGNTAASTSQKLVYDGYVATPYVVLNTDSNDPHFAWNGELTKVAAYDVKGLDESVYVAYAQVGAETLFAPPALHEGLNSFTIRQFDAAGNMSEQTVNITLDTKAPTSQPTLTADSSTNGKFVVSGLETETNAAWYYSIDNGVHWKFGALNGNSSTATLDLSSADGEFKVLVRQQDAAGNIGSSSNTLDLSIAQPVVMSVVATEQGLKVTSSASGMVYLDNQGHTADIGAITVLQGDASGSKVFGAQSTVVSGIATLDHGPTPDAAGTIYTLGTNSGDQLTGTNVWGFDGNDAIEGTAGNDRLFGGAGDDVIHGGLGSDLMSGGTGKDTFVVHVENVNTANGGVGTQTSDSGYYGPLSGGTAGGGDDHGADTIDGFEFGTDVLRVSATGIHNFNEGVYVGTSASNSWGGQQSAFATNVGLVDLDSNNGFGEFAVNFTNTVGTLTAASLKASIQYNLVGTTGNDTIKTGSLADTINGGAGADTITAGGGADSIDAGDDSAVDTIIIHAGDTSAIAFIDGGSTADMDVISNFRSADIVRIDIAATNSPMIQSTYLADAAADHFALVRGSDAGGVFKAGATASDNDYLLQWADGTRVNSVVLHDYGTMDTALQVNGTDIQLVGVLP